MYIFCLNLKNTFKIQIFHFLTKICEIRKKRKNAKSFASMNSTIVFHFWDIWKKINYFNQACSNLRAKKMINIFEKEFDFKIWKLYKNNALFILNRPRSRPCREFWWCTRCTQILFCQALDKRERGKPIKECLRSMCSRKWEQFLELLLRFSVEQMMYTAGKNIYWLVNLSCFRSPRLPRLTLKCNK